MENDTIATRRVNEFIEEVSSQNHAMAGAVIALSASQAAALGQACLHISLNLLDLMDGTIANQIDTLVEIKSQLLQWCNRDANAIAEFVTLREGRAGAGRKTIVV